MGYSKYPTALDNQASLPVSIDLVTPVRAEVTNRLRAAIVAIETELGTDPSQTYGTVRARLDALTSLLQALRIDLTTLEVALTEYRSSAGVYSCASSVAVHELVYVSGPGQVSEAEADNIAKSPAVGMVVEKRSATICVVQFSGEVDGFVGLTTGNRLFLSETLGQFTTTPPVTVGSIVQNIGIVKSPTTIILMIDRDYIRN